MQTDLFGQPSEAPVHTALHLPAELPAGLYLGTSSWSFPGWAGLVYDKGGNESTLAREGLRQYSRHALLRAVGIDRGFYAPLSATQYANYAQQVPPGFRFVVKAPNLITDAQVRSERGVPAALNSSFLDAVLAVDQCVAPCVEGLGEALGALVFQLSPLPREWLADTAAVVERLANFFSALPPLRPPACYALEIRDSALLTPRLMRALAASGVRYCVGVHASMPPVERQAKALALLPPGPLVVRWSLHAGLKYQAAKDRYFPFNRLVDPDPITRRALAALALSTIASGYTATIIANNKAEGCAPLTLLEFAREVLQQMPPST
ncbi:MAG: DUF72 domain-containing protein [Burkholderiaceae bacterium]